MPRPKTTPSSPYDLAMKFMREKHGPEPTVDCRREYLVEWLNQVGFATDAIAYARKEWEKEGTP